MDHVRIAGEVAKGLSIFCATCTHYWSSPNGRCGKTCGSPLVGMSFPHYTGTGALTITDFARFCFMCGGTPHPDGGVRVSGHERVFAVCEKHRAGLADYVSKVGLAGEPMVFSGGAFVPLERVTLRRRSLLEEMAFNEMKLKEKYG